MKTKIPLAVTLLVGNTDNRLTQQIWSVFVADTDIVVEKWSKHTFFGGGPPSHSLYQNFCWVFEIRRADYLDLVADLKELGKTYGQNSIAVITGDPEMVKSGFYGTHCPSCSEAVALDATFCQHCGLDLSEVDWRQHALDTGLIDEEAD